MQHHHKKPRKRLPPWVGQWLRSCRTVDVDTIAERLDRDQSHVSRLETGDIAIPADDLPLVLRAYDVTLRQFAAQAATVKIAKARAA